MREFITDLWDDGWFGRSFLGLIGGLIVLAAFMIYNETVRWPAYRTAHGCHWTGQSYDTQTFIMVDQIMVPSTITNYEWACDDGRNVFYR